jgi:signal transduction histidine kinase
LDAECEREISLINDLLDFQRLEAGEQPLVMKPMRLQDWLPEIVAPFQARLHDRQQLLQLDVSQDVPTLVSDPEILKHLLGELLNNACKYTPPDGQITIRVQAQPGVTQLIVSNTSIEIPKSELAHIFDKFYRIPNADPWKQGGTGLGLALAQKQTAHLGGTITVESTPGQLHFTVALPFSERLSLL